MLLAMDSTPESALGLFSFDAAIVSLSSVWNAASSGCASVTVSGLQFGSHNGSASLALGTGTEYLCHTASWTSVSTTVCGRYPARLPLPHWHWHGLSWPHAAAAPASGPIAGGPLGRPGRRGGGGGRWGGVGPGGPSSADGRATLDPLRGGFHSVCLPT